MDSYIEEEIVSLVSDKNMKRHGSEFVFTVCLGI